MPETIVNNSIDRVKALKKIAKKSKDPLDKDYEVWSVFDCDDHPKVPESILKAEQNGVFVAYSNPCFELWALLHVNDHRQCIHRHPLQSKLTDKLAEYDHRGSKIISAKTLNDNYAIAKQRAIRLRKEHESVDSPKANPYTDVYELLDKIILNGTK